MQLWADVYTASMGRPDEGRLTMSERDKLPGHADRALKEFDERFTEKGQDKDPKEKP